MSNNPLIAILSADEFISTLKDVNSSKTEDVFSTGFIGITEQKKILDEAKTCDLSNHDIVSQGGYPNSGRKIISLVPKTLNTVLSPYKTPFKVMETSDNAIYGIIALNYPNVCGDEIKSPIGSQVIIYTPQQAILENIADTLKSNEYKIVDTTHLLTKSKTDTMELYEASTRLDALTSAIWKVSRTSIIKFINAGLVSLDTAHTVIKPDKKLSIGDTIYCDNKGRAIIQNIMPTKKDRYKISVIKYM
jgi:RNA-binding protein YlmH